MTKKIGLDDIGRLIKPRLLTEAFLLCNFDDGQLDVHGWWRQVIRHTAFSKNWKKDVISSTYGKRLDQLFKGLDINGYVGVITGFIVFCEGRNQLVTSVEQAQMLKAVRGKKSVRAALVRFHTSYNPETKELGPVWEPTSTKTISWVFKLKHLIPLEEVEKFNKIQVGDLIMFTKSTALVVEVRQYHRRKFYSVCSWTDKKVITLSGGKGTQFRLNTNRPYTVTTKQQQQDHNNP